METSLVYMYDVRHGKGDCEREREIVQTGEWREIVKYDKTTSYLGINVFQSDDNRYQRRGGGGSISVS
jgi:hypothetical protein